MDAKNFKSLTVVAGISLAGASLAGCGFKSDLFLPEEAEQAPLTTPNVPPDEVVQDNVTQKVVQEVPAALVKEVDEPIFIDKVVEEASNAEILVSPESAVTADAVQSSAAQAVPVEVSTVDASTAEPDVAAAKPDIAAEGVPVDLSELANATEKKPETQ